MLTRVLSTTLLAAAICSALADSDTAAQYPDLPPGKNYLHEAHIAVNTVAKKWMLSQRQKAAALAFILHRNPVREFEKMSLDDSALLKRGRTDPSVRRTSAYRETLDICDTVSQQMATMIIKDALHTYRRKVLRPDELTRPLFASTSDKEIEDAIAGIWREESRDEFLRVGEPNFSTRAGDKFYSYATSFGGGSLVVRDGKVVYNANTFVY
jgi:hypothetical protein